MDSLLVAAAAVQIFRMIIYETAISMSYCPFLKNSTPQWTHPLLVEGPGILQSFDAGPTPSPDK